MSFFISKRVSTLLTKRGNNNGSCSAPFCLILSHLTGCRLGGVVVSVLATGPKGHGFKPGQGDEFLRAIKIRSAPFFGWEVKMEIPCRKILQHVKNLLKYHGDE
jgi:hypothetical protein